jgi:hypothetical protein
MGQAQTIGMNVNVTQEYINAIDAAAQGSGFNCKRVAWENTQRGTIGGSNIADVRLLESQNHATLQFEVTIGTKVLQLPKLLKFHLLLKASLTSHSLQFHCSTIYDHLAHLVHMQELIHQQT